MFNAIIEVIEWNENEVMLEATCPFCGRKVTKSFANTKDFVDGFRLRKYGELIKKCFPWMSPEDREFFITGNCPCCF